jgi:hypothetical protein
MIKISTWKIRQQIQHKEANLLYRDDVEKQLSLLKSIIKEKLKIMHNKTQLAYFSTETNSKKIEYVMNEIVRVIKWEIAISPEITKYLSNLKYINGDPFREEDILSLKKSLAKGLGVKNHPDTFNKEKQIAYYRDEIVKSLETTVDRISYILDDIKKLCEYDSVLAAIHNCTYVSSLPKRDRKKIYEEKKKFERTKNKTIEGLKFLKLPYDDVEKTEYNSDEEYGWVNYEMTLKHIKKVLYSDLTLICGTGKKRAEAIIKILEYI